MALKDLLVAVPSRGRPGSIARLRDAMRDTCRGDTHLLVGCDADDPTLDAYLEQAEGDVVVQEGMRDVVTWMNYLALPQVGSYRAIGHIGDDNVPRTEGWDKRVTQTLRKRDINFCFGDDLYPGRPTGTLCCHAFMRSSVIASLGYMGPPSIKHMYVDPIWMAWGEATGIEFLPDVILEHMHYSAGKSEMDESYQESLAKTGPDLDAFNAYVRDPAGLNFDIERIRAGATVFTPAQIERFKADLNIPETWPR